MFNGYLCISYANVLNAFQLFHMVIKTENETNIRKCIRELQRLLNIAKSSHDDFIESMNNIDYKYVDKKEIFDQTLHTFDLLEKKSYKVNRILMLEIRIVIENNQNQQKQFNISPLNDSQQENLNEGLEWLSRLIFIYDIYGGERGITTLCFVKFFKLNWNKLTDNETVEVSNYFDQILGGISLKHIAQNLSLWLNRNKDVLSESEYELFYPVFMNKN